MRVEVDTDQCKGHSVCMGLCPEVFQLSDDGYATVLMPDVPAEHEAAVQDAVRQCPEKAISLS